MWTRTLSIPLFFALALVLCLIAAPVMSATLTVTTDKDSYAPGDTIVVTGSAAANTDVTIQLLNPDNQLVDIDYMTSGTDGSYSLPFKIPESMLSGQWPYGTYTVRAFTGMSTVNVTFSIAAPTGRSRHLR